MKDLESTLEQFAGGDRRALARLITLVENRGSAVPEVMRALYARAGRARIIGLTGPPGAGKSTLGDRIIARLREQGRTVGVVAVDPSSPFSGGALLGDRVRMQTHFLDEGVFIRSLSTRGRHGGLARATREVVQLLDAFGFDDVVVETVGVGQTELDVMRVAHTTLVVLVPEAGDTIQVMKAGLLEIADVFIVNKADREGADRLKNEIESMLGLRGEARWRVPVLLTEAASGKGVVEVVEQIDAHTEARRAAAPADDGETRVREWIEILRDEIELRLARSLESADFASLARSLREDHTDPYSAAMTVLGDPERLARALAAARRGGS